MGAVTLHFWGGSTVEILLPASRGPMTETEIRGALLRACPRSQSETPLWVTAHTRMVRPLGDEIMDVLSPYPTQHPDEARHRDRVLTRAVRVFLGLDVAPERAESSCTM